ncbi:hypothetical protein MMC24_007377 [Lignoscripta atroalba]|nr:hypothetical protein [Lignoscripta atroalba]
MLSPTTAAMRGSMLNCRLQPSLLPQCSYPSIIFLRQNSSTSKSREPSSIVVSIPTRKKIRTTTSTILKIHHQQPNRAASTSATTPQTPTSTTTPNPTSSPSTTPPLSNPPTTLTWNRYLHLRHIRRRYNLGASATTGIITTFLGINFISAQNIDGLGGQMFGLDPMVVLGLATGACGAVGWLLGPFVGNAVFGLWYRRFGGEIAVDPKQKEKDFYRRVKRYRVDPSHGSASNPVPDYYGEKIDSVPAYRLWLRDQRAYNKKRQIL